MEYTYKKFKIKIFVDQKSNFWFNGKDVSTILGHKNSKNSIRDHVYPEFKSYLFDLKNTNDPNLKIIYINEPGLFQLISRSKKKFSKEFNIWLYSDLLPSIRRQEDYKKNIEDCSSTVNFELQKELNTLNFNIIEIKRQSEEYKKNSEKEYILRLEKEKELENKKKYIELLNQHLNKHKKINKDNLIYILTNDEDLKSNIFKVGKTTKKSLNARLNSYNTGKSYESYFIYIKETIHAQNIENILSFILTDFKITVSFEDNKIKEKHEMYKIYFEDLVKILNCLIKGPNKMAEFLNLNHEKLFKNSFMLNSNVEKIKSWEYNKDLNKPFIENWFNNSIIKSNNAKDYLSMKTLVQKYKSENLDINEKRVDIEKKIDTLFNKIGVHLKPQHNYVEDGSRKLSRRVYMGFIFKQ